MKIIFYFYCFSVLPSILSIVPNWNFNKSSINLFSTSNTFTYTYSSFPDIYNLKTEIKKTIKYENNKFIETKSLYINNEYYNETDWDGIDSSYYLDNKTIICPKGRNHIYVNFEEKKPNNFDYDGNWDLKCIHKNNTSVIFLFYMNCPFYLYLYNIKSNTLLATKDKGFDHVYDFQYEANTNDDNKIKLLVFSLVASTSIMISSSTLLNFGNTYFIIQYSENMSFLSRKKFFSVNFDKNYLYYYYFNYHNYSDFETGYSNKFKTFDYNGIGEFLDNKNRISPFDYFTKNITINYLKFVPNTKYVYYELINNDDFTIYHGVIDIELNTVIFQTDEVLKEFKPYDHMSMLAYTNNSIYKICFIKNGDICEEKCENNSLQLDINSNTCFGSCQNYILKPSNICIDECNTTLFFLNTTTKECGWCRDIFPNLKYKLLNTSRCVDKTESMDIYDKDLYLLTCKNECVLYNEECLFKSPMCYENCELCRTNSNDENNQKCVICKDKYVNQDGNCLDKCSDGYYETNDRICLKCNDNCNTCQNNSKYCTSCKLSNYFLNEKTHECQECDQNCRTCEIEKNHCTSCINNDYFINQTYHCELKCDYNICKECMPSTFHCLECKYPNYFLENGRCIKCNDNCETCSNITINNENNCITCDSKKYKFLIKDNSTCVNECPDNVICLNTSNYKQYIRPNNKNENEKNKNLKYILTIISGVIFLVQIIILIIIIRKRKRLQNESIFNNYTNSGMDNMPIINN